MCRDTAGGAPVEPGRRGGAMMRPQPPFPALLRSPRRWLLLAALVGLSALLMFGRIAPLDEILKAREAGGILALQFAWSGERANAILAAWHGLDAVVREQTWWDYAFLLCYPPALALACAMLAGLQGDALALTGALAARAVLAAAVLDAIENLAILLMLEHGAGEVSAKFTTVCAGLKFAVVAAAAAYLLVAAAATLVRRARR